MFTLNMYVFWKARERPKKWKVKVFKFHLIFYVLHILTITTDARALILSSLLIHLLYFSTITQHIF